MNRPTKTGHAQRDLRQREAAQQPGPWNLVVSLALSALDVIRLREYAIAPVTLAIKNCRAEMAVRIAPFHSGTSRGDPDGNSESFRSIEGASH